jgi:outer membrane biosynthesis protein TonB
MVDIEKLRAANESVQAVGNMNVNARGDVLGPGGAIVNTKENVIKKYYEQPKGMVSDTPRSKTMPAPKAEPVKTVKKMTPIAAKPAPKKVEAKPEPKVVSKPAVRTEKKGVDAALDGLE